MVQLKITAQKRGDGKGDADNASNKGGPTKSSLAAASALNNAVSPPGQTSSLKLQSKGKGGMKAGSRNEDVASVFPALLTIRVEGEVKRQDLPICRNPPRKRRQRKGGIWGTIE